MVEADDGYMRLPKASEAAGSDVKMEDVPNHPAASSSMRGGMEMNATPNSRASFHAPEPEAKDETRALITSLLDEPSSSLAAAGIHYFICFIIVVSTVAVILETVPELHLNPMFFPLEMCITAIFTIEFTLRLYADDSIGKFVVNPFNIIDFLAIFPGYLELVLLIVRASQRTDDHVNRAAESMRTLRMIRIVRLVRVFRVMRMAKFARHSESLNIIVSVLVKVSKSGLIVVLMMMCFAMVLSASLIFLTESEVCEDSGMHCHGPSAFSSIPAAFWWAIATLTTVGYGDMVPHTAAGKVIGSLTAVAGMIVVAIGIAMVSINFRECYIEAEAERMQKENNEDVGLGKDIDELLEKFQDSSATLFNKLKDVSENRLRDQSDELSQFSNMLEVLRKHSEVLSDDVKVFKKHVIS